MAAQRGENEFNKLLSSFEVDGKTYRYYDLLKLNDPEKYAKLPISIKVLLEAAVRNCDNFYVKPEDVEKILNWHESQHGAERDIPFKPARVLLQDLTGVAVVVDMAGMRDAYVQLGGQAEKLNSLCQVDLVVDHSVQVDYAKTSDALAKNQSMEFDRNKERFRLFKWATKSMNNFRIIPPGSGIVHQINLEYLAHVVYKNKDDNLLYPDSLVGADSHTVMINGLGIVGYGCGGIECEAVMLDQTLSLTIPEVVGFKLHGKMDHFATSTDLVLTITKQLRTVGVVGKFIEFYGPGVAQLSVADRATIANMCPEYGATVAFFPVDDKTIAYLKQTGRDEHAIRYVEQYLRLVKMFRSDFNDSSEDPIFSQVIELNLAEIVPSLSGPKRPHDRVPFAEFRSDFRECLTNPVGFKGFGLKQEDLDKKCKFQLGDKEYILEHGSIVIAAITSCTNTSNPSVMLGAGMLAKKAVELGLTVKPYIKTSLSPGSGVVTYYLRNSKVLPYLEKLGFYVTGYGCQTCIGNSGPLEEEVDAAIAEANLVCVGVLSGNRNFEGRIHSSVRANYLASPLLVVASAIAGKVIDFQNEPLGKTPDGKEVFLRDIWPTKEEIDLVEREHVVESMFREVYSDIERGNKPWAELDAPQSVHYPWDETSNYLKKPFFFDKLSRELDLGDKYKIENARALLVLGDSISTDMISPAGFISKNSPAYEYLLSRGVQPKDINSYGSYRGNDNVMIRGTFANIRLNNKLASKPGPKSVYLPDNQEDFIYNVSKKYQQAGVPLIVLAGKEYGCGSSRDWAAKGVVGLGVRAIIAESYERIHRSNLVGMSVLPLQFMPGQNAENLKLTGKEIFSIDLGSELSPGQKATVYVQGGELDQFTVEVRFDTEVEIEYYKHGSILHYMLRQLL